MKKLFFSAMVIFLLFANCKKEDNSLKVVYSVSERSAADPTFTVTYVTDKSGTTMTSSSRFSSWSSGTFALKPGQFVSMKVECSEPTFDIKFGIYVNGWPYEEKTFQSPVPSETISGHISQ